MRRTETRDNGGCGGVVMMLLLLMALILMRGYVEKPFHDAEKAATEQVEGSHDDN